MSFLELPSSPILLKAADRRRHPDNPNFPGNLAPHFTHYISTMKRWIYQDDLVTWHRIYFLWYVIAFCVAMWTVPAPEPSWGLAVNFRPVQSDCIVAHLAMREHRGDFCEP
jgi:hypothetical protein